MNFDELEYISIQNQTTNFPKHFHETFCISLIHKGTEQIDFEDQSIFVEAGTISITNPYEIHANPLLDNTIQLSFDTIYFSEDLMSYFLNGKSISFVNRKINSNKANQQFLDLIAAIDSKNPKVIESMGQQFIDTIKNYSEENKEAYSALNFESLNQINEYIEDHICDKFSLEALAKIPNINKFGFAKKFKASTGMTPMNYILMRKIFSCKKLISTDSQLTDLAYDYNFTDLSHFSRTFKRYIGISPKAYQESLL